MAKRPIFITTNNPKKLFEEREIEFQFFNGFSVSQKAKSIKSLHEKAKQQSLELYAKALPMARKYFNEKHQIMQMILNNIELAKKLKKQQNNKEK